MKTVLILGYGQIGQSVEGLYKDYDYEIGYIDKETCKNVMEEPDVMHICIPYTDEFVKETVYAIERAKPKMVIINSTVAIGTTRIVAETVIRNEYQPIIVHSPVIGVHPNLTKSIQTFKKIIGAKCLEDAKEVSDHFESIGVNTYIFKSPEDSEAAKLLSTTYYATAIRYMQEVHKMCEENNLNFEDVYSRTNEIYNEGYDELGMRFVNRPILKYMGEGISGHCLVPNAKILRENKQLKKIVDLILGD